MDRRVGPDGNENRTWRCSGEPRDFLRWHGEDVQIGEGQSTLHGVNLRTAAETVDEARASERLDVMKDEGDANAGVAKGAKNAQEPVRKAAAGK